MKAEAYAKGFKEGWDKAIEGFKDKFNLSFIHSLNYYEHYYISEEDFKELKMFLAGVVKEDLLEPQSEPDNQENKTEELHTANAVDESGLTDSPDTAQQIKKELDKDYK